MLRTADARSPLCPPPPYLMMFTNHLNIIALAPPLPILLKKHKSTGVSLGGRPRLNLKSLAPREAKLPPAS